MIGKGIPMSQSKADRMNSLPYNQSNNAISGQSVAQNVGTFGTKYGGSSTVTPFADPHRETSDLSSSVNE
jgi:hypothetical protein